jgi:hypothetical protein
MKINKMFAALVSGIMLTLVWGCQKHEEGPAEHVGKAVDNAVDKVGQSVEKAGEKIQDAAKGVAPTKPEDTGNKAAEKTDNAKK